MERHNWFIEFNIIRAGEISNYIYVLHNQIMYLLISILISINRML